MNARIDRPIVFRLSLALLLCGATSCRSWGTFWEAGSVTAFRFEATTNLLHKTYEGRISDLNVTVDLPYALIPAAIATFSFQDAAVVSVAGKAQVSGVTMNDFSSAVVYTVGSDVGKGRQFTVAVNPIVPIPDTGQNLCYTGTGSGDTSTPCTGNIGTYPGQDADFATPNTRNFSGPVPHPQFGADYTTRDRLTGVLYKTCSENLLGVSCTGTATMQQWAAVPPVCAALNTANGGVGYAGRSDWRVPAIIELVALLNFQNSGPTSDGVFFPATQNGGYWTAEEYLPSNAYGWAVSFNNAVVYSTAQKTLNNNVRCVAGARPPGPSFSDNGDATVTDNRTQLLWQKCPAGLSGLNCSGTLSTMNWANALTTCTTQNLAGKSWRLPNANELRSIADYSKAAAPAIDTLVFPGNGSVSYWTSTTPSFNQTNAWAVDFGGANIGSLQYYLKTTLYSVRCVAER